jgi:heterotetrameric sarcosine oxidase gamma subunit
VTLEFLSVDAAERDGRFKPVARSAMERQALAAGASFELRDGWNLAVSYEREADALSQTAAWADVSHLRKLELQGEPEDLRAILSTYTSHELELGRAERADGVWWCPLTATRLLVIAEPAAFGSLRARLDGAPACVVDVTTVLAALVIAGPLSREVFARFCALDLRPAIMPVGAVRPGSVARQPGIVLREAAQRFLVLFGWAVAEYMWSQVEDAAGHLGGTPAGLDALAPLDERTEEVLRNA